MTYPWDSTPGHSFTTTTSHVTWDILRHEIFSVDAKRKLYNKIRATIDFDKLDSISHALDIAKEVREGFVAALDLLNKIDELESKIAGLEGAKSIVLEFLSEEDFDDRIDNLQDDYNDAKYRYANLEKAMAGVLVSFDITVEGHSEPKSHVTWNY